MKETLKQLVVTKTEPKLHIQDSCLVTKNIFTFRMVQNWHDLLFQFLYLHFWGIAPVAYDLEEQNHKMARIQTLH